jgi:hypothetical protein
MADAVEQRIVSVDVHGAAQGTPMWLVVEADGGTCAIAAGRADGDGVSVGVLGAARAAWLGDRVSATTAETAACAGLPALGALIVPPGGSAVRLADPVAGTDVAGPFAVRPIGGPWWEVRPIGEGSGTVVFRAQDGPPVALSVGVDPKAPSPPGSAVRVALGGVAVVPSAPSFVDLGPDAVAEVVQAGGVGVVVGRRAGVADGLWRLGEQDPEPVRIEVTGPPAPRDDALVVPAGGHRVRRPDDPVLAAVVGDPKVLEVVLDGAKLRFVGLEPGRTEVALQTARGVSVVPVAVGR